MFTSSGYTNFHHARGKKGGLELHAKSQCYSHTFQAWKSRTSVSQRSVASMISSTYSEIINCNRHYINTVEVVLDEEMAFRGNNEKGRSIDHLTSKCGGNFLSLMRLISYHDTMISEFT